MKLYLMRHGDAVTKEAHSRRPLSAYGREQAEKTAEQAAARGVVINTIYHSPKTRAAETAEILAELFTPYPCLVPADNMLPLDGIGFWKREINSRDDSVALVGHMPFLAELAMALLKESRERKQISFRTAQMHHLKKSGSAWNWEWTLLPL